MTRVRLRCMPVFQTLFAFSIAIASHVCAAQSKLAPRFGDLVRVQAPVADFAPSPAQENVIGISLRLERSFAARRDKVFGLWTDPHAVAKWFLPPEQAHWAEPPRFEARPGGRFSLRLVSREEFYDLHGTFREVHSPEKLVLNWQWDKDSPLAGSPGNTEVTVEFFAQSGKTRVVLTQFGFQNDESRGQYERGWSRCFREMDNLLAAVPAESITRWKEFI